MDWVKLSKQEIKDGWFLDGEDKISPLRVCQSAAGYYIGRLTDRGLPYSRESLHYYPTRSFAQEALDNKTWTQRSHY